MKKIYLFIAVAMIALSCSDDDSAVASVNPEPESLIGKWNLTAWKIGNTQQDINFCQEEHDYFLFTDEDNVTESFGELDGVDCMQQEYDHTYTITGDILHIEEITTGVPFQAKFKILEANETEITIKQYWVSQENPSGGVDEENIPENEQGTYTYTKQ